MKEWKFRGKRKLLSIIMIWIMATVLFACGSVQGEGQTSGTFSPVVFMEGTESSGTEVKAEEETADRGLFEEASFEEAQSEELQSEEPQSEKTQSEEPLVQAESEDVPQEDGIYTDKEQVACYLHVYGHLPDNYITKKEAEDLGWDSGKGNLNDVAPGKSIGGGRFGNREGLLPEKQGRTYYECDIDYEGGYRGAKRIVYSNDGLIYYTEDHYNSFELLYTSEGKAE